jgi:hypothetical protein
MAAKNRKNLQEPPGANKTVESLRRRISEVDLIASGTILKRTKVCGRPNCRCATDPASRHGPYFEWTRREGGRFLHSVVSQDQARHLARAIRNYRTILRLLERWRRETARILGVKNTRK